MSCVRPISSVRPTMLSTARFAPLAMLLCCAADTVATAAEPTALDELRINQLQTIGTHNSYHIRIPGKSKREVPEWNYNHAPLDVQLDRGVRSFELDLHYKDGEFEVFHVPLLDEGTTCRKLSDALATVRKWSDAHPTHVPISFLFELKKEGPGLDRRIREVDAEGFDRLDQVFVRGLSSRAADRARRRSRQSRHAARGGDVPGLANLGRQPRQGVFHLARRRHASASSIPATILRSAAGRCSFVPTTRATTRPRSCSTIRARS